MSQDGEPGKPAVGGTGGAGGRGGEGSEIGGVGGPGGKGGDIVDASSRLEVASGLLRELSDKLLTTDAETARLIKEIADKLRIDNDAIGARVSELERRLDEKG